MMKKRIYVSMLFLLVLFMAILVGCESKSDDTPVIELKDWGITLIAVDVTPTGLTIVCEQGDGEQQGRLQTGSDYWLEIYEKDTWQAVPNILEDSANLSWTAEAWIVSHGDTTEWTVDWEWLYGKLPSGTYRIGKLVSDFVEGLTPEKQAYYAVFTIE